MNWFRILWEAFVELIEEEIKNAKEILDQDPTRIDETDSFEGWK